MAVHTASLRVGMSRLLIAFFSYRRSNRAFWPAMIFFTFTGLGAIWVPLRPQAHVGEDTLTLIVHAFVDDLPGLFVGAWLIIDLIRFRHAWSQRSVVPRMGALDVPQA